MGVYIFLFGLGEMVGEHGDRLAAGTNENVLAHALGVALLISLFLFNKSRIPVKSFLIIADLFIIFAIALTGSRGVWVALVFSIVTTVIFMPGLGIKRKLGYLISIATLAGSTWGAFVNGLFGQYGDYLSRRLSEVQFTAEASSGRMDYIWPFWVEKILEQPILGGGTGYTHFLNMSTHNDLLHVLANHGLIGLILYLSLFLAMLFDIRSLEDSWARMCCINLLIFLFVGGFTHNTIYYKSFIAALGMISLAVIQTTLIAPKRTNAEQGSLSMAKGSG